jgi:3-methyl-2-indolic acid synthase
MSWFRLEIEAIDAMRASAAARAARGEGRTIAKSAGAGALDAEAAAVVLLADDVATDDLVTLARTRRDDDHLRFETFSPLYITNECDAECRMCGMRRANADLVRETADAATVDAQLDILHRRGLRAVAILSGEYRLGARRRAMIERAAAAVRAALARDFQHVLVNIGSLDAPEYDVLLDGVPRASDGRVEPRLTMCTFQETYQPEIYGRFMGTDAENPRSDYARRLLNFDRARDAGIWVANPGVLLGLNPDLAWELLALVAHVQHLESRGMDVYVSVPRLRRATGTAYPAGVGDDQLCRLVAVLALAAPNAKVVISTREPADMQRRLVPVIGVLTPGSPGVAPYTESGARFELEASQFEVLDHRPIEAILGEYVAAGATIDCFEPARPS